MEQDKQLKEILSNSVERASAKFTDVVMQKINDLEVTSLYYQPLVSSKIKKLFVFTFSAVIAAVLGLCLISALTKSHVVSWIQNSALLDLNYGKILMFILTFWVVFILNSLIEKRFLFRKQRPSHTH